MTKRQKVVVEYLSEFLGMLKEKSGIDNVTIDVCFNKMNDKTINAFSSLYKNGVVRITFNKNYVSRGKLAEIKRTCAHEIAHCVTMLQPNYYEEYCKANDKEKYTHNEKWGELLRTMEYDPNYYNAGDIK